MTHQNYSVTTVQRGVVRDVRPRHPYTDALPANVRIERRGEGVYLITSPEQITVTGKDGKPTIAAAPDFTETRVDSQREDNAMRLAGREVWWDKHLAAASKK